MHIKNSVCECIYIYFYTLYWSQEKKYFFHNEVLTLHGILTKDFMITKTL